MYRKNLSTKRYKVILYSFHEASRDQGPENACIGMLAQHTETNKEPELHHVKNRAELLLGLIEYIL